MNLSDVLKQTVTEIGKREDDEMYRSMKFVLVEEKKKLLSLAQVLRDLEIPSQEREPLPPEEPDPDPFG
jgi:hypothetical protein